MLHHAQDRKIVSHASYDLDHVIFEENIKSNIKRITKIKGKGYIRN